MLYILTSIFVSTAFGNKPPKGHFGLIFNHVYIKILQRLAKNKKHEKADFDQCLECAVPKHWSKYTTAEIGEVFLYYY